MAALAELNRAPPFHSSPAASTRRKRLHLEEDDDFFAMAALAEAETTREPPQPTVDLDEGEDVDMDVLRETEAQEREERERTAVRSTGIEGGSSASASTMTRPVPGIGAAEGRLSVGDSSKDAKGKGRMRFEEDDDFGGLDHHDQVMFASSKPAHVSAPRPLAPQHDYSAHYGSVSSLNMSLRPGYIEAASVQATTLDGRKIILRRKKKLDSWVGTSADQKEDSAALARLAASMLEQPYHRLLQSIQQDVAREKKQNEANATNAALNTAGSISSNAQEKMIETTLWTDKYRPKRFVDLLGDERVHRTALLWLKEWDSCVFKGTMKANAAAEMKKERRNKRAREGAGGGSGASASGSGFGNAAGGGGFEEAAPDPYGRPQEKILLLSGPPGLGKTTLAHVLARQAGYQVLEINASDDRTGRVVEERIRNALDSTALTLGWNAKEKGKARDGLGDGKARPTCVVVDEVDGAGGGGESSFVKTLVKLVMEGSSTKKPKKNGKSKKDRPLLRPIICICNDLYAPVLRPLRPLAKIIRFSPPTNTMLVKRLKTICEAENLGAENKHLTLLVDTAEGDLRSCLNTLQFIKRRGATIDEQVIRSTSLGMKDTGTSAAQVLDRLFKKPLRRKGVSAGDEKYVGRIVKDVQTSGEYEKISQGCFENYLLARGTNDEAFPRINQALDWLFLYDQLDHRLRTERDYELLAYVPYTFVSWYPLFSSQVPNPVELPKTDYEMYLQRVAHQEVAEAFTQNMPQALKALFTGTNIVAELLPLLNRIVSPDLKPVNSHIVKNEERATLLRLVNTMITTKLSFVLDKNEEGQLSYKLDPPIDVFVHFGGKRASDMAPSRYAVRQMINREIDSELLRRGGNPGGASKDAGAILSAYKTTPQAAVAPDTKQAVDFFGRVIVPKTLTASQEAAGLLAPPPTKRVKQARYHFREGFSNAVRTTKRVSDFFA
ncbi:hypothetical protein JCM1841_004748 [Sporobolomyces salmonicolor]